MQVFPVSARGALLAQEAKQKGEGGFITPEASAGFSELEAFILKTLSVRLTPLILLRTKHLGVLSKYDDHTRAQNV